MFEIRLPRKLVRIWLPAILICSLAFLLGGFYFWRQGLSLSSYFKPHEEGEVSGASLALDIPPEVPFYNSAKLVSTSQTESGLQFAFETEDSLSRVYNFYERQLLSSGWKKSKEAPRKDGVYLLYTRGSQVMELNLVYEAKTRKTVGMIYFSQ
jgi:hypothetical protein